MKKYSSKLDIYRSLIRIFELKFEDTVTRREKYSSKLDIYRSLIRIFAQRNKNSRTVCRRCAISTKEESPGSTEHPTS